jgi:hypothetical protein
MHSLKLNQARLDGKPEKRCGLLVSTVVATARNELAKRQRLPLSRELHGIHNTLANRAGAMGCLPHAVIA